MIAHTHIHGCIHTKTPHILRLRRLMYGVIEISFSKRFSTFNFQLSIVNDCYFTSQMSLVSSNSAKL